MEEIIIRYLHFLGILGLSATLVAEHLLIAPTVSGARMRKLALVDAIFGASAGLTLVAGLLLWFWVGKPAEFYNANWIFHTKITLFVIIALLSIYPTVFFLKNRKNTAESIAIPKKLVMVVRVELLLLLLMPLLAALMAKGVGL